MTLTVLLVLGSIYSVFNLTVKQRYVLMTDGMLEKELCVPFLFFPLTCVHRFMYLSKFLCKTYKI